MTVTLATPPIADWIDPVELTPTPVSRPGAACARSIRRPSSHWPSAESQPTIAGARGSTRTLTRSPRSGDSTQLRTMRRTLMIDPDGEEHLSQRTPTRTLRPKAIKERGRRHSRRTPASFSTADRGRGGACRCTSVVASPLATKNLMDFQGIRVVDVDVVRTCHHPHGRTLQRGRPPGYLGACGRDQRAD